MTIDRNQHASAHLSCSTFMILTILAAVLTIQLTVAANPDFSISASPTSVVVSPGPQGNSTITLTSQGFAGTVNMTSNVTPNGLYCQLTKTSLTLTANGSNSTLLHCDGNPGNFTVTVIGNAVIGGMIVPHSVTVNYVVADFSVSANPSSISLQTGQRASTTVTVSSRQVFAQKIYLNLTLPSGINGSITPTVISGPGPATLNVNSTQAGVYNITIVAASGSISHKQWLLVTVTNPPSGGSIFGLAPIMFYTALAMGIVLASAAVASSFLLSKRSRKR